MKFYIAEEKLAYVEPMLRRVADQYLSMMNAGFLFRAKLDVLEVFVDGSAGIDSFQGQCTVSADGSSCRIQLHVTPDLNEAETAVLIAHELGHMMISNMGVGSLRRGDDDDIVIHFGVMRSEGCGTIIGLGLEEAIVEFMALEVVSRMSEEWKKAIGRSEWVKEKENKVKVAEELSKCFGKPLRRLDQFDQTTDIGKKVSWINDSLNPAVVAPAFQRFENVFWQCLSKQSFELIGKMYDEVMGQGEYRKLCIRLDEMNEPYDMRVLTAEERLIRHLIGEVDNEADSILQEIKRFRRLKAQKDREEKGVSERKIALDSLKEAIDLIRRHCRLITHAREKDTEFQAALNAFCRTLNKGRAWKCIPAACAALERVEKVDMMIYDRAHVEAIRQILNAACEVAGYYGEMEPISGNLENGRESA